MFAAHVIASVDRDEKMKKFSLFVLRTREEARWQRRLLKSRQSKVEATSAGTMPVAFGN
jgi:hypothetical protein